MSARRICHGLSIAALCILAWANHSHAQENPDDAARILFDAGAKAYASGLYADAVTAFREAYALAPDRATVLFSLAQAERRQYTVKQDPALLESAILHFRKYLELVTEGGRRADAVVALGELEALRAGAEAPVAKAARIFITTETPGATIFVDGEKRNQVPVIEEAVPGKHVIKIDAPGFIEETREIVAVQGTIFPLEINLREKPSYLTIKAPIGASITVDGRVFGDAPLPLPVETVSGSHRVLISQRGYIPHEQLVSIDRAGASSIMVALKPTAQRRTSYFLFGASMTTFGVGAGLILATLVKDAEATAIYERTQLENIDRKTLEQYRAAHEARNLLIASSSGLEILAFGLGAASALTYWFDSPTRRTTSTERSQARVSVTPLSDGGYASFGFRF